MATSLDSSPSPTHFNKKTPSFLASSPLFSPASDKRFWSTLRCRVDALLESRQCPVSVAGDQLNLKPSSATCVGESNLAKRMKEDSLLLVRGFDSISHTLSQLSNNLENALQGARSLAEPPTMSQIFQSNINNSEIKQDDLEKNEQKGKEDEKNKGVKRKFDQETEQNLEDDKLKKAKNLAISMATKAASLARELNSIRSALCFMQERCSLLEEENRRLRDGVSGGIRPEEDELMRLQMEVLLAEKSRLATENANLTRENQCLHQLVEYHQLTSQDFSSSYEQLVQGICLDFSSPLASPKADTEITDDKEDFQTPGTGISGFSTPGKCFQGDQH